MESKRNSQSRNGKEWQELKTTACHRRHIPDSQLIIEREGESYNYNCCENSVNL